MTTLYDTLYSFAQNQQDLTRWLHDEDVVQDYRDCLEFSVSQEKQLMEVLENNARYLFENYTGNVQGVRDYERQMFFCQGLAMGLELGVRACR